MKLLFVNVVGKKIHRLQKVAETIAGHACFPNMLTVFILEVAKNSAKALWNLLDSLDLEKKGL